MYTLYSEYFCKIFYELLIILYNIMQIIFKKKIRIIMYKKSNKYVDCF